ncbi:MAG: hypothetical protein KME12_27165 [Trichocoleus desertorum ATA4-8-CV12]|jgi:hypothetical protein|nr:hypothetical protein [Trichocoleus desertorum ATA4-8-CV12]
MSSIFVTCGAVEQVTRLNRVDAGLVRSPIFQVRSDSQEFLPLQRQVEQGLQAD